MFALTSFLFTETQTETPDNVLPLAACNEARILPKDSVRASQTTQSLSTGETSR